uniref:Uncharacterized protein n=1 Tax=Anguilla anguilla TaxID=7936 RepID=A0A0E9RFB6_ANGAN
MPSMPSFHMWTCCVLPVVSPSAFQPPFFQCL